MRMRVLSLGWFGLLFSVAVLFSACATMGGETKPTPAPDFTIKMLDGREASLAQFKGRPLMICVGATWCPHCLHEAPIFKKVHEKYKDRLGMLGVLIKSKPEDAKALVKKEGLGFDMALDPDNEFAKAYNVKGIPAIFIINSEGMIVDEDVGGLEYSEIVERVDKLLATSPPAGK